MKRVQLFEFEDFSWFPTWLRTCMTNLIVVLQKAMGIADVLTDLIARVLLEKKLDRVVDLGSGSGGAMPEVLAKLQQREGLGDVQLLMTDLYPNTTFIQKFNQDLSDKIAYHQTAVDATNFSKIPKGLKTMINSFHHMRPAVARAILKSAEENRQAILIYEMAENKMPLFVWWLLLPLSLVIVMLMALLMTPFVRPLTCQQLVFTYLIPLIPICYAWDGQASLPRMYAFQDIDELLKGLGGNAYTWEKGHAKKGNGKKLGTYLLGFPTTQ